MICGRTPEINHILIFIIYIDNQRVKNGFMMLFLMSLSCVAAPFSGFGQMQQPQPNITLTLSAGGRSFKTAMKKEQNRIISFPEIQSSSIFILGEDGQLLFSGSFKPKQRQASTSLMPGVDVDYTKIDIQTRKWKGEQIKVNQIEIFSMDGCGWCDRAKDLARESFGEPKVYNISSQFYLRSSQKIINKVLNYLSSINDRFEYNKIYSSFIVNGNMPRISVIDNNNVRWFLGGFDGLQKFINSRRIQNTWGKVIN